jgi:uncharacterized protein YbjT (DUF2867 family)
MTPIKRQEDKELAYRESDGISVSLRCNRETGDVSVLVEDSKLGESFVVPAAVASSTTAFTAPGGIALRYGIFYGDPDDGLVEAVRARKFPVVGDGAGVWGFIHLEDAASATVLALEHEGPAIYNIVDDEPVPRAHVLVLHFHTVGRPGRVHPRPTRTFRWRLRRSRSIVRTRRW